MTAETDSLVAGVIDAAEEVRDPMEGKPQQPSGCPQ
jgi:hypothetical protein